MKMKKMYAFIMALVVFSGIFPMPVQAAKPEERIEVLVSGEYSGVSLFDSECGIYRFENENGVGLYSLTLGWLTECQWIRISQTELLGFYMVQGENGYGLLDYNGNLVISAEWDKLYLDSGIVVVCDNGLWGLMDIQGNLLHDATFSSIDPFFEGYAKVYQDKKCGFVNTSGKYVTDLIWTDAQEFSDSLVAVKNQEGLWGYINTQGEVVIPCQYNNASAFKNGYASVLEGETVYVIKKNNEKVLVDGEPLALEPVYDCLGYIAEIVFWGSEKDIACVLLKGEEKYCYIDKEYNQLTKSIYKYAVEFEDGDYCVSIIPNRFGMEKYAVLTVERKEKVAISTVLSEKNYIRTVNFDGTVFFEAENRLYDMRGYDLFGMEFDKYIYHYDNSNIINASYKGQYVCVDFEGKVISPLSDYQFYYVSENLYMATADDGRVKLCDEQGNQIAETDEYAEAYYAYGYIYVKNDSGKWGLCDTDCNMLIEPMYDKLYDISEGMLRYKNKGKYGFINMETQEVIRAIYSNVSHFREGYCWVSKDVLIGAIDKSGEYIIKPLYWGDNDCTGFGGNNFIYGVTSLRKDKDGKYGVVNRNGQKILDFIYSYISAFGENGVAVFEKEGADSYICGLMKVVHNDSEILPTKITTDKSNLVVYEGCYEVITETVLPDTAADLGVSFASANEDVAVVDEVGRVYGVSEGETVIVLVSQAAGASVIAVVQVEVLDRTLYAPEKLIPREQWEGQSWLSNIVLERLGELGISKTTEELTYGDLLEVKHIRIDELEDPGESIVYHIPEIIGEFSNLMTVDISPEIFVPLVSTKPDSVKFLSNLESWYITNTYGQEVDEYYIRNNNSGIPDKNLYKAIATGRPIIKGDYVYDLKYKGIQDLTGVSLVNLSERIDLSCNYITDINELRNVDFEGYETIDLSYNQLDLTDEATVAIIAALEEKGCTVITEGQNEIAVIFAEEYYNNSQWINQCPMEFKIVISEESREYYKFYIHNGEISDLNVVSADTEIADGYIEKSADGSYEWYCRATGVGETSLYLMEKATGKILYEFPVTVSEPRFWAEPIEVSYYVSDYEPFYAELRCENGYEFIEYRLQGTNNWNRYSWPDYISKNGVYEVRYCNWYGRMSDITVLEISGIKERLAEEQMPDANLRNYFNGGNVYEGYKVDWLDAGFKEISDIKGLSLLDFSQMSEWSQLDLSYNKITDISELAKLNISNKIINLSYNRIDFTQTANAEALRELYRKGCTVEMNNQFYKGQCMITGIESHEFTTSYPDSHYGDTIRVYNGNIQDITLVLRGGEVLADFSWENYDDRIYYQFKFGAVYGTEYIDVYYKGELVKTAQISVRGYGESEVPRIQVSDYSENWGFNVNFDTWGYSYEYRKQGSEQWTVTENQWFNIEEEGTYEFRVSQESGYSDVVTVELKQTEYAGLKMFLNQGEWRVYDVNATAVMSELVIPETVEGYPITDISGITNVSIKSLYIPKTVTSISSFYGCNSLEKITIDERNPYYYSENNCIISKQDYSLVGCMASADIVEIPEGVQRILSMPSANATKLIIPSSVSEILAEDFFILSCLEEIEVKEGNRHYYSQDGILYEKYTGKLVACTNMITNTLVIPEKVLFINSNAFRNSKLKEIHLPKTLLAIGDSAFYDCYDLETVTFFGEIVNIRSQAFWNCSQLTDVYYSGTQHSWEKIAIYEYGNENLLNAKLHFICGCGEKYSDYIVDREASCTSFGKGHYVCGGCGKIQYVIVDLLKHNFVDSVCSSCGTECSVIESEHNYADNLDTSWTVTKKGAKKIALSFSVDTQTESCDYIYIYNGLGELVGSYASTSLAAKTITVDGDTVTIRLTSDGSVNYYGFYAEVYAVNIEYETGDVNGDIMVDVRDLVRMKRVIAGMCDCDGVSMDMDGDSENTTEDVALFRQFLLEGIMNPHDAIKYNTQYVSYDAFHDEHREEYIIRELCFEDSTLCIAWESYWAEAPGMQGSKPISYNGKTYYGGDGGGYPLGYRVTENEIVILDYDTSTVAFTLVVQQNGELKVVSSNVDEYRVGSVFVPEESGYRPKV